VDGAGMVTRGLVECRVLGPLRVDRGGVEVPVAGQVAGRVLAALSTAAGVPMADDVLAEVVWGDELPGQVAHSLRVAVSRLRGKLGTDCVLRTSGGYAISIPAERVDHHRFADSVGRGLRCQRDGDAAGAVRAFEGALGLWRGRPWPELGESSEVVTLARMRLEELRLVAVEELQAARLVTGDFGTAIAALRGAVAETPYRERRWELLATGLCLIGQPARARTELLRIRHLLAEDLGIDPGPALRSLEHRIPPTLHQPTRHQPTWRWR
jgi:DNA-binding SARP family transcriptional activator